MENAEHATPTAGEEDARSCTPRSLIGGSFTPTNRLLDRLESFADFLLCNLKDWTESEPPWPPPPLINFSGSDRAIKGHFPHRRISVSSLLRKDFPLFRDEDFNSSAASLLSSEVPRCSGIADASASFTQEAHLAPSSLPCRSDQLEGSELVNNSTPTDFSALPGSIEVAAEALLVSKSHTSPFVTLPESSSANNCLGVHFSSGTKSDSGSSESHSLVHPPSGKTNCLQTNDSSVIDPHLMCRQLEERSPSHACPLANMSGTAPNTRLSPNDGANTAVLAKFNSNIESQPLPRKEGCLSREERVNIKENVGVEVLENRVNIKENAGVEVLESQQQRCDPKEVQVSYLRDMGSIAEKKGVLPNNCGGCTPSQSTKNAHFAPERLRSNSPQREGNLHVEERERRSIKQTVGLAIVSSHQSFDDYRCKYELFDVAVSAQDCCTNMGNSNLELENLSMDVPRKEDNLLAEESENANQNVGPRSVSSPNHQLEEGELSDQQMDRSSEQSGSALMVNDNNESGRDEVDLLDVCGSTRQQLSSAQGRDVAGAIMGSPIETCLPRYFTRSSIRKADAEELTKKHKLNDKNDENKKVKKSSRKQRKTENKQKRASKQVEIAKSGGTAKDGHHQLGVKRGPKKLAVSNKAECALNAQERTNKKLTQETTVNTTIKTAGQCEMQGKENVFVPEMKQGFLSSIVEGEVGLWTTDAGDDQILTAQTEGGAIKKAKRTLTAGRKKAKQRAKHRKRAEKEKALGIRKLVFKAPEKEIIKFCQFYIKGRCSKGTSCTFSHDIIPRTKSEMCKYYINRCCLKGDDCPFSHELSSFPCKFFHTRGHCLEGESCRFSHKPIDEETRLDLLKKIDREHQARQEALTASDDTVNVKVTPATALIAENDVGLQMPEKSTPLLNARHLLRDDSSQSCKPAALKVNGSVIDVNSNDSKGGDFSISRPDKEVLARDEGITNSVLWAARKAASAFNSGVGSATEDLSLYRSPLLYAGLQGRRGASLNKGMVSDCTTAVVSKENREQLATLGIASMIGASGFSAIKSPKTRAMELLQASLEASQLITRSKCPASLAVLSPLGCSSDSQNELPKSDTNTCFSTVAARSPDSSGVGPMKCLPTTSEVKPVDHISKVQDVISPVLSSSTTTNSTLNLLRVKSDAPSRNKRPTVESLLSKILME